MPLFFVMALGYFAGWLRDIDNQHVAELNALVMDFALPASLFVAMPCWLPRHIKKESDMNAPVPFAGQTGAWSHRRAKKAARLARVAPWMKGLVLETGAIVEALQSSLNLAMPSPSRETTRSRQTSFHARLSRPTRRNFMTCTC